MPAVEPDKVKREIQLAHRVLDQFLRRYTLLHDVGYSGRGWGPGDRVSGSKIGDPTAEVAVAGPTAQQRRAVSQAGRRLRVASQGLLRALEQIDAGLDAMDEAVERIDEEMTA